MQDTENKKGIQFTIKKGSFIQRVFQSYTPSAGGFTRLLV